MAGDKLESANSLNIDNFFAPDAGFVAEHPDDDTEDHHDESGEADELDTSEEEDEDQDEEDAEDDEDSEDEDDDSEEDQDDSTDAKALKKEAATAEAQRREIQSKYDSLLANYNKEISSIKGELNALKSKANQTDIDNVLDGDDDDVVSVGQVKQIIAKANEQSASKPAIGTDKEAQEAWVNTQPDSGEVVEYFKQIYDVEIDDLSIDELDEMREEVFSFDLEDHECCSKLDSEYNDEWEIDISKLPKGISKIKFTNSY